MADLTRRYSDNVAGPWYVDDSCIDCNMCRVTAPHHFERNDLGRYTYVTKQPDSETEWALCQQALEECPVNAIGFTVAALAAVGV